jgi:hypothetical protein
MNWWRTKTNTWEKNYTNPQLVAINYMKELTLAKYHPKVVSDMFESNSNVLKPNYD